ncbi:hypothetical protein GCM10007416_21120 [Kroppenstedtia guangzhouensis]|uniref:Uncharacterized protein n=1 Tax=Kroppenstedtia guangzhouensis TaxID=1274356 RepID=A0ABQ1GP88_9BACL|nr:hypothetical protein GCM10007416_21120 [Kroppenstedtia guangzhouensis]
MTVSDLLQKAHSKTGEQKRYKGSPPVTQALPLLYIVSELPSPNTNQTY